MRKLKEISMRLLLLVFLTACDPAPPQSVDTPFPTIPSGLPRSAVFSEIVPEVESRVSESADFEPAEQGQELGVGGQAQTGGDGRARLDILPDGTVVRIAGESRFTLTEFSPESGDLSTQLQLAWGQLWIILNGGELEVRTESGDAAVRGSMMSATYDDSTGDLVVTCLEGHCTLGNELGEVALTAGQASEIPGLGNPPNPPRPISPEELEAWEENMPEAIELLEKGGQEPPPPGSDDAPPGGEPGMSGPLTYSLTNNCFATWYWQFDGPVSRLVEIPQGQTVSGELPPGVYTVRDWNDNGHSFGPYEALGGGHLDPTFDCPDPEDTEPEAPEPSPEG